MQTNQPEPDEAAYVDSFFLPGGILDPEDEDRAEDQPFYIPPLTSNPWETEQPSLGLTQPRSSDGLANLAVSPPSSPEHRHILPSTVNSSAPVFKPPPGFETVSPPPAPPAGSSPQISVEDVLFVAPSVGSPVLDALVAPSLTSPQSQDVTLEQTIDVSKEEDASTATPSRKSYARVAAEARKAQEAAERADKQSATAPTATRALKHSASDTSRSNASRSKEVKQEKHKEQSLQRRSTHSDSSSKSSKDDQWSDAKRSPRRGGTVNKTTPDFFVLEEEADVNLAGTSSLTEKASTDAGKPAAGTARRAKDQSKAKEETSDNLSDEAAKTPTEDAILETFANSVAMLVGLLELLMPVLQHCFRLVSSFFASAARILIIVALGLANIFKYALEELDQNDGAFLCYMVFYLFPSVCDFFMSSFSLPHYTPHLVSSTAFYLMLTRNGSKRKPKDGGSDRLAENLCKAALQFFRFTIPFDLLVEGFTSPNTALMMTDVLPRLLLAYMLSVVRANLIFSPVAWVSWAIQGLVAVYFPANLVSEGFLVMVGLASVRLCTVIQIENPAMDQ